MTANMIEVSMTYHAKEQFIERILGISPHRAGDNLFEHAEDKIKETVRDPDMIYNKKTDMPPISIKGDIAAVTDEDDEGPGVFVPTVYHSSVFIEGDSYESNEKREA